MAKLLSALFFLALSPLLAQQPLTSDLLEPAVFRFSLDEAHEMDAATEAQWLEWIGENQFIGLAEVHNSAQLSYFTKALVQVLAEKDFRHFALEMGPTSARILQDATKDPDQTLENLRSLNRKYGKNAQSKTPMIFANKVEDAVFVEEASKSGYTFWGLDQEFSYSYEMLIDHLYDNHESKDEAFEQAYSEAKSTLQKVIFKNKHKGKSVYCWYPQSEELNHFFDLLQDTASQKIIGDLKTSWDIYCKSVLGYGSNQQRADYMKANFENCLNEYGTDVHVFTKLGSAHLARGLSPFGVNDVGKYLTEKAEKNKTGFLSIRQLIAYRNGKSNIGKSGWKMVTMFLELGRKDQWTAVDLRPYREMLRRGEITADKKFTFELNSYDILLIPPDDQYPEVNY